MAARVVSGDHGRCGVDLVEAGVPGNYGFYPGGQQFTLLPINGSYGVIKRDANN